MTTEIKQKTFSSNTVVDNTGSVTLINGLTRGYDEDNRIARKVIFLHLEVHCYALATAGTGTPQPGRMLVVCDHQSNGATPAVLDILQMANPRSPMNYDNRHRFTVLADWYYSLCNYTGTAVKGETYNTARSIKIPARFDTGNGGLVADYINGAMFIVSLGQNAAGVTAGDMWYSGRLLFVDN